MICRLLVGISRIFGILFVSAQFTDLAWADEDALVRKAKAIAADLLGERNSIPGIEHVGGPFLIEEYDVRISRFRDGSRTNVGFQYKRPHGIVGWPDSLSVTALANTETASIGSVPPCPPIFLPYRTTGDFAYEDLEKLLRAYSRSEYCPPERKIEAAVFESENKIVRKCFTPFRITEVRQQSPDEIQIRSGLP